MDPPCGDPSKPCSFPNDNNYPDERNIVNSHDNPFPGIPLKMEMSEFFEDEYNSFDEEMGIPGVRMRPSFGLLGILGRIISSD